MSKDDVITKSSGAQTCTSQSWSSGLPALLQHTWFSWTGDYPASAEAWWRTHRLNQACWSRAASQAVVWGLGFRNTGLRHAQEYVKLHSLRHVKMIYGTYTANPFIRCEASTYEKWVHLLQLKMSVLKRKKKDQTQASVEKNQTLICRMYLNVNPCNTHHWQEEENPPFDFWLFTLTLRYSLH